MQFLKKLDAFAKADEDFRVKTNTGAIVSIATIVLMVMLFFSELSYYRKTETVDHLYVNTTLVDKIKIDFDLSFPEIPCGLLSIDALDEIGQPQLDAVHDIYKYKLTTDGKGVGKAEKQELGNTLTNEKQLEELTKDRKKKNEKSKKADCGGCYGAGEPGECCNTCEDVQRAYERVGWKFKPQGISQCENELFVRNLKDQFAEDGGCRIFGELETTRASGHFHIAPHKKLHESGQNSNFVNLLELISFAFDQFNITHTINSLSFGDEFPGNRSPLDGQNRRIEHTHGMYQYYTKVVPTRYRFLNGSEVESNQYAVTEHFRALAPGSGRGFPGVYFYYEVSPIQAVFEEKRKEFHSFLTGVCAIIGGAYTVMGLFDAILSSIMNRKGQGVL